MQVKVCQLCAVDFTLKNFLLPLIDGMQEIGWNVVAVCSDGPEITRLRKLGYRIEIVYIDRSFNILKHIRSLYSLVRLFRSENFDVVHVHTPVAALIGRIAARIAGVPLIVYTAHGFYFHDDMPRWKRHIFVYLEKFGSFFTDMLFTQSKEDADTAKLAHLAPDGKIFTIGNGVDHQRFNPHIINSKKALRNTLGVPEDAFVVGFIGRLVGEKGISDLLSAAKIVIKKYQNVFFFIIGERLESDHASSIQIELTRAQNEFGTKFLLLGARNDIPECLSAMDLFCLPSWREGMPRTIIEAMSMGKPVLATDIRGSREEVINEVTGLLVPVRSPEFLAQAIARFVDDINWSMKLGDKGRERALAIYDEYKIIKLQISLIERELCTRHCFDA